MRFLNYSLFLLMSIVCFNVVASIKILAVFPTQMKSHFIVGKRLISELVLAGHEVTVISPYKINELPKTYRAITTKIPNKSYEDYANTVSTQEDNFSPDIVSKFMNWGIDVTEATMNDPNVQKLLNSNETFDVMLYEVFINDALLGFGHHFKIPVIGLSTTAYSPFIPYYTGTPLPDSYVPNMLLGLPEHMNFYQRLINCLSNFYLGLIFELKFNAGNNQLYDKYFPDPKPTLHELRKTIMPLMLTNGHISLNGAKPFMTNVIEIGGIHIDAKLKPLPTDLQSFMDSADKEGIVYFCMGSNISPKFMKSEQRNAIINALKGLKQKIVWKWDHESADLVDQNKFYTSNWLPQNEILAHKNVKLFITHGGLLGTMESVYHGVPLLGIPMFADQKLNMVNFEIAGLGLKVDYSSLNEENFKWALNEILTNKKYDIAAREAAARFKDRPLSCLDTAIFWIEYVVRHHGAFFMQSVALKLNFIELHNLDVYLFLIVVFLFVAFVIRQIVKLLFKVLKNLKQRLLNIPILVQEDFDRKKRAKTD